jgi:hypothetical protein
VSRDAQGRCTLRAIVAVGLLSATTLAAFADVWMVKAVNAVACEDRQALVDLEAKAAPPAILPTGCIKLYLGERLLEQPQLGQGFAKYLKVERGDGSFVFVRSADVLSDPGIGSVSDDRR